MVERAEGQMPFGNLGMELVVDLDSGDKSLRPKKAKKVATRIARRPAPTRQWWERMGLRAFSNAADGWRGSQSARAAETFGQNVEFAGAEMSGAETEERLKRAFRVARSSGIKSLAVAEMMRTGTLILERKLGSEASWLPEFVDSAVDALSGVYNVNLKMREALRAVAHLGTLLT